MFQLLGEEILSLFCTCLFLSAPEGGVFCGEPKVGSKGAAEGALISSSGGGEGFQVLSSFLPKHAHQRGVRRAQEPEPGINSCQNHCLGAGHLSSCFPSTPVEKRPAPKPGSHRHPSHSDLVKERQRGKAVKEGRAERGNRGY